MIISKLRNEFLYQNRISKLLSIPIISINNISCVFVIEFIKTSISRFMNPNSIEVSWAVILVVLITIVLKEVLARLSYNLGDKINSSTLIADAIHHRSDMWSSVLVLSAFGGAWLGYPKIDAIMGLGVALLSMLSSM